MTEQLANWALRAAKEWGLFAAMCVFFIGWSYLRENDLNARFDAQNRFIQQTLVTALNQNTAVLQRVATRFPEPTNPEPREISHAQR